MDLENNTPQKEITLEDVTQTLQKDEINHLEVLSKNGDTDNLILFFNKFKKLHSDLESSVNEEQLAKEAIELISVTGSLITNTKNHSKMAEKREYDFKVGDLVSTPLRVDLKTKEMKDFLKGTITEVKENALVIDTLKEKNIEIPRKNAIVMYPGQKFDIREVAPLFPYGKVQFKEFDKAEILSKILKGKESDVHNIAYTKKLSEGGSKTVSENVRFKINKIDGEVKVKVIKALSNKIYNREITPEELVALKKGESITATTTKKDGSSFDMIMFYDKELDGVRAKAVNTKPLEKAQIYSQDLTKDEIGLLNKGKTIVVGRKDKEGKDLTYTVSYNKDLKNLNVKKGGDLKASQKETVKEVKKVTETPKVKKAPKARKM